MSDIVIIGAGIGGLTAAIRLAVAGHHVTVLEKNGQVENRTIYAAITSTFMRPHNRCPDVRGLYFAGGTTHPGGGVPMVTLSGKVAAELLLEDLAKSF